MTARSRIDPEALLAHRDFVRALVLRLVGEPHAADDVVQETWLAALQNAPARPRSLRAWLARVARNLALRHARREVRLRQRARKAPQPDAPRDPAGALERVHAEHAVVAALLELDEPYRTTLLLRYYDDLAPREVAARLGVPAATVRTRLKRGLDTLRARLDQQHGGPDGGRRAWALPLIPLLIPIAAVKGAAATTGGIVLMTGKGKALAAAALLLAALLGFWKLSDRAGTPRARTDAERPTQGGPITRKQTDSDVPEPARDRATVAVAVRVLDPDGHPVPDAQVGAYAMAHIELGVPLFTGQDDLFAVSKPVLTRRTDAAGEASFPLPLSTSTVFEATAQSHARARSRVVALPAGSTAPPPVVLHLRPAHALTGTVRDDTGAPWPGVAVWLTSPTFGQRLPVRELAARTITDKLGRYRFGDSAAGDYGLWCGSPAASPSRRAIVRLPHVTVFDVVLPRGGCVHGVVTRTDTGAPVAGATVEIHGVKGSLTKVRTNAQGEYRVAHLGGRAVFRIRARAAGLCLRLENNGQDHRWIPLGADETYRHDLKLESAPEVYGVVRGPDGPLAGIAIAAYHQAPQWHLNGARTVTDSEGRYRLSVAPVRHQLSAAGGGFAVPANQQWLRPLDQATGSEPFVVDVPERGAIRCDLELASMRAGGIRLAGRVTNDTDDPVAGALVSVFMQRTWTDAAGAFELDGIKGEQTWVVVAADGFRTIQKSIAVRSGSPISLTLERARTVTGRVTAGDGATLDDAAVLIAVLPRGWARTRDRAAKFDALWSRAERVRAARDGSFTFTVVDGRLRYVRATARGRSLGPPVALGSGDTELVLTVPEGGARTGRVLDADSGEPIAGARIRTQGIGAARHNPFAKDGDAFGPNAPVVAVSAADGTFVVARAPTHRVRVAVEAFGYRPHEVVADESIGEVRLAPNAVGLAGTVRYDDGAPAIGLVVFADPADGKSRRVSGLGTSPTGRFELRGLRDASYRITVGGRGSITRTSRPMRPGRAGLVLTVRRARAGEDEIHPRPVEGDGVLAGHVVDFSGHGIADAKIRVQWKRGMRAGTTNADGAFSIRGLADGEYRVSANLPGGWFPQSIDGVKPGTTTLRLEFGTVTGVVVDENGQPVAGVALRAHPRPFNSKRGFREVRTGQDGRFTITGLLREQYKLTLKQERGQPARLLDGANNVAPGPKPLRLVARAGATIAGRVVRAGVPEKGLTVTAERPGHRVTAPTNAQGAFVLTGLRDGENYGVAVWSSAGRLWYEPKIKAGTRGLDCALEPGHTITGRLVDNNDRPLREVRLRLRAKGQPERHATTDATGRFEITDLAPTKYEIDRLDPTARAWISCGTASAPTRELQLRTPAR